MSDHLPQSRDDERPDGTRSGSRLPPAPQTTSGSSQPRDVWRASASFGWLIGTLLLLISGALIVLLVVRVPSSSGGQRIAWVAMAIALVGLVLGIAVLLRALPTMRYRFVDDGLVIEWFGPRRLVPLSDIVAVTFEPDVPLRLPRWEPFWPGYYVATVRTPSGTWHSWATQRPERRVRMTTSSGIVAISPERPVRFVAELERRCQMAGATVRAADVDADSGLRRPEVTRPPSMPERRLPPVGESAQDRQPRRSVPSWNAIAAWFVSYRDQFRNHLLADQIASALVAIGVVVPVLMVAYLYSQYEALPNQIPIQWDAVGDVTELTSPSGLWRFPRIAVVVLVINTLLATALISVDRYLARLLMAGIPLVQLILFVALIRAAN